MVKVTFSTDFGFTYRGHTKRIHHEYYWLAEGYSPYKNGKRRVKR